MDGQHVIGVVAQMQSAQPQLADGVERTRQILIQTAQLL